MSNLLQLAVLVFALTLIGLLLSLVALLPPVRRLARRGSNPRITVVFALALISFAFGFAFWTRLSAEAIYAFGTMAISDAFDPQTSSVTWPEEEFKPAIVSELWTRLVVPPPMRQVCYAADPHVCTVIDHLPPSAGANLGSAAYLRDISIALVSLLACAAFAWRFTRQRQLPLAAA